MRKQTCSCQRHPGFIAHPCTFLAFLCLSVRLRGGAELQRSCVYVKPAQLRGERCGNELVVLQTDRGGKRKNMTKRNGEKKTGKRRKVGKRKKGKTGQRKRKKTKKKGTAKSKSRRQRLLSTLLLHVLYIITATNYNNKLLFLYLLLVLGMEGTWREREENVKRTHPWSSGCLWATVFKVTPYYNWTLTASELSINESLSSYPNPISIRSCARSFLLPRAGAAWKSPKHQVCTLPIGTQPFLGERNTYRR